MHPDIEKIVLTESRIAEEVAAAAKWLDEKFASSDSLPLAVCVLKGSAFFFCDLVRAMKTPLQIDFTAVSSYGNSSESDGKPATLMKLSVPLEGRDVIIVEDIIDSGNTLFKMKGEILRAGAKSFTAVTLFDKPSRRTADIQADYSCFEVGNDFIVGYGLDYAQRYRTLPYVGILKREIYENKG